jgi:HEAT repeat protein
MQQKLPESSAGPADPGIIVRRQGWADDLKSPNLETRLCAVQDLSHTPDPENIRLLIGALENGNWQVREGAFNALCSFGEQSVPLLCEALGHRNDEIVWRVSFLLGALKARRAVGPLILLLGREGMIRECAIWSLGEIGDDSASTALLRFIRSDDPVIQREAETALGKIGNAGKENCS